MLSKENFYFCYSKKLSEYLAEKGFRYLFMAKEFKTGTPFSIYERSKELGNALSEYKLTK